MDLNGDCCVNTADEKILWLKFDELRPRDVAIATNFVARDGDKLAFPAYIVRANMCKRVWDWEIAHLTSSYRKTPR